MIHRITRVSGVRLLAAAVEARALEQEPDSLLGTLATFVLIACEELDAASEHSGAIIDVARPRGWLIALAHGSFLRAIALVRAGRMREAEADARLAFDIKLANSPPPAVIWSLFPLVDALTVPRPLIKSPDQLASARRIAGIAISSLAVARSGG